MEAASVVRSAHPLVRGRRSALTRPHCWNEWARLARLGGQVGTSIWAHFTWRSPPPITSPQPPDSRFQDYQIPSEHFTMHDFCHPCVCCFSYSRRSLCGINQGSDYNQGWQGRFQIPDSQIPDSSFTDIQIPDSKFQTPLLGGQGEADSRFQIPRVSGWDSGVRDKADSKFQIPESLSQG